MSQTKRAFEDYDAVRKATPLLFGIVGPSNSGKTFSSLRLATGIQRVTGGDIWFIDTEANRALAYSDLFKFRHVPFDAPFSPLDYLAAIEHCANKGAKIIIVDSASHEHEGPGGVLEWHQAEVDRLMKAWRQSADKVNFAAWQAPKAARRRLINSVLQMNINFIFNFRAKEKIKVGRGDVTNLGFMPIGGDEWIYEMTAKALLLPGAEGVPTWHPDERGEKQLVKLPIQFRDLFSGKTNKPLDEDTGEAMAEWAAGGKKAAPKPAPAAEPKEPEPPAPPEPEDDGGMDMVGQVESLRSGYALCEGASEFAELESERRDMWKSIPASSKTKLKLASSQAKTRLGL